MAWCEVSECNGRAGAARRARAPWSAPSPRRPPLFESRSASARSCESRNRARRARRDCALEGARCTPSAVTRATRGGTGCLARCRGGGHGAGACLTLSLMYFFIFEIVGVTISQGFLHASVTPPQREGLPRRRVCGAFIRRMGRRTRRSPATTDATSGRWRSDTRSRPGRGGRHRQFSMTSALTSTASDRWAPLRRRERRRDPRWVERHADVPVGVDGAARRHHPSQRAHDVRVRDSSVVFRRFSSGPRTRSPSAPRS